MQSEQNLIAATLSAAEFAAATGLKVRTVYNYCKAGLIPAIRINRVYRIRRDVVATVLAQGIPVR